MTEQERFERFQANEIRMDYDEFKRRFDEHERITGERYGKGGQFHKEWKIWDKAAQQKESVDIDADQLSNFIRKIDGNNSMGAGALAEHIVGWLKTTGYSQQKEGYVLVPVEPNIHMIGAGMGGFVFPLDGGSFSKGEMVQAYKAMIAAVQEPT